MDKYLTPVPTLSMCMACNYHDTKDTLISGVVCKGGAVLFHHTQLQPIQLLLQ